MFSSTLFDLAAIASLALIGSLINHSYFPNKQFNIVTKPLSYNKFVKNNFKKSTSKVSAFKHIAFYGLAEIVNSLQNQIDIASVRGSLWILQLWLNAMLEDQMTYCPLDEVLEFLHIGSIWLSYLSYPTIHDAYYKEFFYFLKFLRHWCWTPPM